MNINFLTAIAQALVASDQGLLAMDGSTATCNARFAAWVSPKRWKPAAPTASCW